MDLKEFEKLSSSIEEKLGKEKVGLILDDLALLKTDIGAMNKDIKKKDKQITKLTEEKEKLVETNISLFQQVSSDDDDDEGSGFIFGDKKQEKEVPKQPFNYRSAFDEKGNFKR